MLFSNAFCFVAVINEDYTKFIGLFRKFFPGTEIDPAAVSEAFDSVTKIPKIATSHMDMLRTKRPRQVSSFKDDDHLRAVVMYTQTGHRVLNDLLRRACDAGSGPPDDNPIQTYGRLLNQALPSLPMHPHAKAVYRGEKLVFDATQYEVGNQIVYPGFTSTTGSTSIRLDFATAHITKTSQPDDVARVGFFEIFTLNGRQASTISKYSHEMEVILPPYSAFDVTAVAEGTFTKWGKQFKCLNVTLHELPILKQPRLLIWVNDPLKHEKIIETVKKQGIMVLCVPSIDAGLEFVDHYFKTHQFDMLVKEAEEAEEAKEEPGDPTTATATAIDESIKMRATCDEFVLVDTAVQSQLLESTINADEPSPTQVAFNVRRSANM